MKMACLFCFFGPAKVFFTKILARQAFLFQILARQAFLFQILAREQKRLATPGLMG